MNHTEIPNNCGSFYCVPLPGGRIERYDNYDDPKSVFYRQEPWRRRCLDCRQDLSDIDDPKIWYCLRCSEAAFQKLLELSFSDEKE